MKCTFIFLSIYRLNKDEMPLIERVNLTKVWGPKDKSLKIPDKGANLLQRVNLPTEEQRCWCQNQF